MCPPYLATHSLSDRDASFYVAVEYGVHANCGLIVMANTRDAPFSLVPQSNRLPATNTLRLPAPREGGVYSLRDIRQFLPRVHTSVGCSDVSPTLVLLRWLKARASHHQLGSSSLCARSCGLPTAVCCDDRGEKPCALLLQSWTCGSYYWSGTTPWCRVPRSGSLEGRPHPEL